MWTENDIEMEGNFLLIVEQRKDSSSKNKGLWELGTHDSRDQILASGDIRLQNCFQIREVESLRYV